MLRTRLRRGFLNLDATAQPLQEHSLTNARECLIENAQPRLRRVSPIREYRGNPEDLDATAEMRVEKILRMPLQEHHLKNARYMFAINACPNSEHFTSCAPSIKRAKSYVTTFC